MDKTTGNAGDGNGDDKKDFTQAVEGGDRGPGAEDELRFNKEFAEPSETLEPEVRWLSRDILVGVTKVIFPNPGTDTTVNDGVPDLTGGGHDDRLESVVVDVVVERLAVWGAEVEDDTDFTRLWDRQDGVAPKAGDRRGQERTGTKSRLQPADDVVSDKGTMFDGSRCVRLHEAGKRGKVLAGGGPDDQFIDNEASAGTLGVGNACEGIDMSQ